MAGAVTATQGEHTRQVLCVVLMLMQAVHILIVVHVMRAHRDLVCKKVHCWSKNDTAGIRGAHVHGTHSTVPCRSRRHRPLLG